MPKREFSSADRRDGSSNGDDLSQGISKAPKRRIDLGDRQESSNSAAVADGHGHTSQESAFSPWTGRPFSSRYYSILETRRKLPVYLFKDKLMDVVKANQVVIVEGASVHRRAGGFSLHFINADESSDTPSPPLFFETQVRRDRERRRRSRSSCSTPAW
jgi:hypothetical protein